jgi:hypothetical protein
MAPRTSVHRDKGDNTVRIARLEDRYRNELMGVEERQELRDRILKLKKAGPR